MDISLIICTSNRADSLRKTLECLVQADRSGLQVEIVVVDNNSTDATKPTVDSFKNQLPLRYIFEPKQGNYVKSHALNRAFDEIGLGDIVAILDDDMSPHPDWFQGVKAISTRWPDKDLFTGRSYPIWPVSEPPAWALSPRIRGWILSTMDYGNQDRPLQPGMWFSSNHYWFRSRILQDGLRIPDLQLVGEAEFMLNMIDKGYQGVCGPDAITGHRLQSALLDPQAALARAACTGRQFARIRLNPKHIGIKQVQLFKKKPLLARGYCLIMFLRYALSYSMACLDFEKDRQFEKKVYFLERKTAFATFFRLSTQYPEYRYRSFSFSLLNLIQPIL